jgi:hypothetical protein
MEGDETNRQYNHSVPLQKQQRKKSRENRRNQRFRRKSRAQQIKPAKIEKLLNKRNHINMINQRKNNLTNTNNDNMQTKISNQVITHRNTPVEIVVTTTTSTNATTVKDLNKRKRDISLQDLKTHSMVILPKSTSSTSIVAQPLFKKVTRRQKKKTLNNRITQSLNSTIHMNYRLVSTYFDRVLEHIKYFLL